MNVEFSHPAAMPIDRLLTDCEIRRGRRSGPGGQHRNKVETAISIVHLPSQIRAEATERRSQEQNRRIAVFRLRVNLAIQSRSAIDIHSTPSALWNSRLKNRRLAISASHQDFPSILAEALDVIGHFDADVKSAAESLACSTSQLTRILKIDPRAMQIVNRRRQQIELPALR